MTTKCGVHPDGPTCSYLKKALRNLDSLTQNLNGVHDGDGLVVVGLDLADVLAGVLALDLPDLQVVTLQLDPTVSPNLEIQKILVIDHQ